MVRKICLDSDVLIAFLHKDDKVKKILVSTNAEFYITSVNTFEVWYGRTESELAAEFLPLLPALVFDDVAGRLAADMLRTLKAQGKLLDMRDLFIAAICIIHGVELFTYNLKHFERLEQFGLIIFRG